MNTRPRNSVPFALALAALLLPPPGGSAAALAAVYEISWWTVDCCSAMRLAGGAYSLCGTVGQPDAQCPPFMTGGPFELTGGFWQPPIVVPPCNPCDTNCDGTVNQFDIASFLNAVLTHTGCSACAGDANGDGTANQFDIQGFIDCILEP